MLTFGDKIVHLNTDKVDRELSVIQSKLKAY